MIGYAVSAGLLGFVGVCIFCNSAAASMLDVGASQRYNKWCFKFERRN